VEWLRERILATSPPGIAQALHGLGARPDSREMLGRISVPTLVVVGEEDVLTPPAEAEAMGAAIPGSRVAVIPRAGHISNLENPAAYNDAVAGFLDTPR
jgi:3-oxoadipate enol-lactonase